MPPSGQCVICSQTVETAGRVDTGDEFYFECALCGSFILTDTALALAPDLTEEEKAKFRGWVYDQNVLNAFPTISSKTLKTIKSVRVPSFAEKADRLLLRLVSKISRMDQPVALGSELIGPIYGMALRDVSYVAEHLEAKSQLKRLPGGQQWRVTPEGHIRADELRFHERSSSQGFVAMWFSDDLRDAYESGFAKGIQGAGYDPFRVDRHEHANKIDDEIIAQIRRSRFLVADFTGHRGGVYFEAGFALGIEMPVVWTCRKDGMSELHFDIRQFNCIDWDAPDDLATRLQVRIEALLGDGPNKQ